MFSQLLLDCSYDDFGAIVGLLTSFCRDLRSLTMSVAECPLVAEDPKFKEHVDEYTGPVLKHIHSEYKRLVERWLQMGIVDISVAPVEYGLLVVKVDGGSRQRLVVDARRTSRRLVAPPPMRLLSIEGLAKIDTPASSEGF